MDLYGTLSSQQRQAVFHSEGPMFILAGPGSGKTHVMACRVVHLINSGVSPEDIAVFSFTKKAVGEMRNRLTKYLGAKGQKVEVMTFHAYCFRFLRKHLESWALPESGGGFRYQKDFEICEGFHCRKFIEYISHELYFSKYRDELDSLPDEKDISDWISLQKRKLISAWQKTGEEPFYREVYRHYAEWLLKNNKIDFGDLLLLTIRMLETNRRLREEVASSYLHVMSDEYQDTDYAQFRLLDYLTQKNDNFCAVGDPDQCIYSWRGANPLNMKHLQEKYVNLHVYRLETNYRSTRTIVEASNCVIANNRKRFLKQSVTTREQGERIFLSSHTTQSAEADFVVAEMERLYREKGIDFQDMAIICRTNNQFWAFENALRKSGIEYQLVEGVSFFEQRDVQAIVSELEFFENSTRGDLLKDILERRGLLREYSEKSGCIQETKKAQGDLGRLSVTLPRIIKDESRRKALGMLLEWWWGLQRSMENLSLPEKVGFYVEEMIRKDKLENKSDFRSLRRLESYQALQEAVESAYRDNACRNINDLLTYSKKMKKQGQKSDSRWMTTVSTIHGAKGREYRVVFVAGLVEDLLPHYYSIIGEPDMLEEERRMFYVAMTRAKDTLYLTWPESRTKSAAVAPSRFLREVPAQYLDASRSADIGRKTEHDERLSGDADDDLLARLTSTTKPTVVNEQENSTAIADAENTTPRPQ